MAHKNEMETKLQITRKTKFNTMDVCRLCLVHAEGLDELTQHLTHIIYTCFSLKICSSPELTNKICQECIDHLRNVYNYRKKIMKNERFLIKKLRHAKNYSSKFYPKNSQEDCDIDIVNDNTVKMNLNEIDLDVTDEEVDQHDLDINVNEEKITEMVKQDKDTSLKSEKDNIEHKEKIQKFALNIENMFRDLNESNKELDNFKTDDSDYRVNNLNNLHRDQHDIKYNPEMVHKEIVEDLITNKDSLEINELPLSEDPIKFQSVNQYDTNLETDKENADMNNLSTNHFNDNKNEIAFKEEDRKAEVVLNNDQFSAFATDRKFMCLTCLNMFDSQKELSVHYKTEELSKAMKETSKKYTVLNIVKVSKNDCDKSRFKCGVCSKAFKNKTSAVKHTQVHKIERPFLCNLCGECKEFKIDILLICSGRTYKSVDDILRHGVVHNGNKFVCSYDCGYTTVHLGALRDHVKRHKKEYKYKCDKCDKCFQVKTWYDQHQNVHDKVRPFVCNICGQAFSMARYLTSHRANVHPQSSGVKRYKCVHCGLPCDSPKSLGMHMKQKHGMKTDCLCDVCGQILSDQHKLSLHKTTHKATRKYSCRFCKKTFTKNDHKTVHEKIHTGERLSCNKCPKSFTQRCSLRRHVKRYHPGDQQMLEQKI